MPECQFHKRYLTMKREKMTTDLTKHGLFRYFILFMSQGYNAEDSN